MHDEKEGPLLATWPVKTSYVVLGCEAKDGVESTNSKPTLLEDQRKVRRYRRGRTRGFLPCNFVKPFDISGCFAVSYRYFLR